MSIPAWDIRVTAEETTTHLYIVPRKNLEVAGKIFSTNDPRGIGFHEHLLQMYKFFANVVLGLTYTDLVKALNAIATFPDYVESCCEFYLSDSQEGLNLMHKHVPDISAITDAPPFDLDAIVDITFSRRARMLNWGVDVDTRLLVNFDKYPRTFDTVTAVVLQRSDIPDANLKAAYTVLVTTIYGLNKTEFADFEKTLLFASTFPDYCRLCLDTYENYPHLLRGVHYTRHPALDEYNNKPHRRKRLYDARVHPNLILDYYLLDNRYVKVMYGLISFPSQEDVFKSMSAKLADEVIETSKVVKKTKVTTTKKIQENTKKKVPAIPQPARDKKKSLPQPKSTSSLDSDESASVAPEMMQMPAPIGQTGPVIYAQDPYLTEAKGTKQFTKMYTEDLALVERYIRDNTPLTYYARMWFYHYHHQYMEKLDGELFRAGAAIESDVLLEACRQGRLDASRGGSGHPTTKPFALPKLQYWPRLEDMCDLYGGITRLHLRSDLIEFLYRKFYLKNVVFDTDDERPVILECEPFYCDFLEEATYDWPHVRVRAVAQ
jgi:hypothetical protein